MSQNDELIKINVSGEYACFSRPEFKVERVSYPVITPSAARGVLEAIFWKPEFRYEIRRVGILKLGSQTVILKNELADRQGSKPFYIEDGRQQRSSLMLKNVAYSIEAEIRLRPHCVDSVYKYIDQFRRRVDKGQHYHTPYLGTRECAACVMPMSNEEPPYLDLPVGTMLFDIAFVKSVERVEMEFKRPGKESPVGGYAQALFFSAEVKGGWLNVPKDRYRELYHLEGWNV
ncbi:MAG: type I-C CRISPR-associated protein Cas5c [Syntrophobacterales bacterium]|jgi:CRISPR-associated protein Cas5d|nr:type I-C CRISPR-associated protein Cas5c [Syntrophobacterales bacterium]